MEYNTKTLKYPFILLTLHSAYEYMLDYMVYPFIECNYFPVSNVMNPNFACRQLGTFGIRELAYIPDSE